MAGQAVSLLRAEPWSGPQLAAELISFRHQIDLMELRFSLLCAEFAQTDQYELEGSTTPIDWIRFNCAMTSNAAADRVAVGEQMAVLPGSVQALAQGKIGFAHLTVMARTAGAVGERFCESELLEQAFENSPGKFHHLCLHYRHAADPKAYAAEQAEQVEKRRLSMSTWEDGSLLLNGVLDPIGGAVLRSALEPLARRSGAHDDRDLERRQADALVELAAAGQQTQLQVTSSVETLLGLLGAPAAEMEFSLPVSARTVERLACDCSLTRVLLGSESAVIEVARAGWSPDRPGELWWRAMATAPGRAASGRPLGAQSTMSCIGSMAAGPTSTTWSCSVTATTGWCMRATGSSSSPMAGCSPFRPRSPSVRRQEVRTNHDALVDRTPAAELIDSGGGWRPGC